MRRKGTEIPEKRLRKFFLRKKSRSGLKNPEIEIDKLYPQTTKILISQGEKLAAQLQCEIVKMDDLTRFSPRESPYELRFKDIKASLPSEFCSSDKDKIKISLILRADFIVRKKKSEK